jgi:hypothetical protein
MVIYQKVNVSNYSNENKSAVLLWAYREGLYTNWISVLNVNDNIIRMNMWILCEYNWIMLLLFHSSMAINVWNAALYGLYVKHHGLTDVLNW